MWSIASGYATAHSRACIPPSEPPLAANTRSMPSSRRNARCARTMSPTVTTGKSPPYGRPVRGFVEFGPVEPRQLPMRLLQTTKWRSVSNALPGPIMPSHQPRPERPRSAAPMPSTVVGASGSSLQPAACASPESAWQTSTTLSFAGASVP